MLKRFLIISLCFLTMSGFGGNSTIQGKWAHDDYAIEFFKKGYGKISFKGGQATLKWEQLDNENIVLSHKETDEICGFKLKTSDVLELFDCHFKGVLNRKPATEFKEIAKKLVSQKTEMQKALEAMANSIAEEERKPPGFSRKEKANLDKLIRESQNENATTKIKPNAIAPKKKPDLVLDDLTKEIETAIKRPSKFSSSSRPLSIAEINAVRQHVAKCWNPPIGAKDAEKLKIEIEITMNPDGTPRAASIGSRISLSDPFYRAAAESALRAVNNRRCWPYPLSPENYHQWQDLTLIFDPKELLGL